MKTINEKGFQEIKDFLITFHKDGERLVKNPDYLQAWASFAEQDQDYIHIELKPWESWRGRVELLEISDAGVDTVICPDELDKASE